MTSEIIINIIQVASIVIASFTAIYGITSWRKEAKWKRKYELAEDVLSCLYEVSDAFDTIRSPFSHIGEGRTRKRRENEHPDESEILDQAYVVIERFNKEKDAFLKLRTLKYRFMAIYGKESGKPFNELVKLTNKLFTASNRLGNRYWKDQGRRKFTDKQFEKHLEEMHKYESIFWATHDAEDKFREEIDQCIDKIERLCEKVINRSIK